MAKTKKPKTYYQKVVDKVRKDLLQNAKAMLEDGDSSDEEKAEYAETVAQIKAAKTLGALSNIAQDLAWDYESFIGLLLDSLGGKEPADSAMFDHFGWDT